LLNANPNSTILRQFAGRVSSVGARIDMHRNAWFSPDGSELVVGYGARPLLVPKAIDTFGTLSTGIA
jgi:hypothetical protein